MNQLGLRFTIPARVSVASSPNRFISRRGTRALHQRQALPYPAEHGLGKFLPPEALKVQLEYQDGLLERLNEQLGDTMEVGNSIAQTVINLSKTREQVLAFNYASLALNNSFFLSNLKPPSDGKHLNYEYEIQDELHMVIRNAHGSVQQLRSAFSAAALGTFINGWVWFVTDQACNTGIITTYGAGTLLVRSRMNMQKHPDIPSSKLFDISPSFYPGSPSYDTPTRSHLAKTSLPMAPNGTQAQHMSDHASIRRTATGSWRDPVSPVLCPSV